MLRIGKMEKGKGKMEFNKRAVASTHTTYYLLPTTATFSAFENWSASWRMEIGNYRLKGGF